MSETDVKQSARRSSHAFRSACATLRACAPWSHAGQPLMREWPCDVQARGHDADQGKGAEPRRLQGRSHARRRCAACSADTERSSRCRSRRAVRWRCPSPPSQPKVPCTVCARKGSLGARLWVLRIDDSCSRTAGENGTPNTAGRYSRYSMASSKDVPPDAKMLTLLQQYREAQEERLRIEGLRGLSQVPQPPVQNALVEEIEQVAQNAHGTYVR